MAHYNIFTLCRASKERLAALQVFNPPGNEEEENCRRRGEQQFAIQTIEEVAQLERRMFRST